MGKAIIQAATKILMNKFFFLIVFLSCGFIQAQDIKPVLEDGDIEHFISTFKPMIAELEALGHTMSEDNDDTDPMAGFTEMSSYIQEIMTKNEVMEILEKYDWAEDYGSKYIAISMGYFYNTINMELDKMSDEEKEMAKPMVDMFLNQIVLMVHKDDIEMLKSRMADLDAVFEDM